MTEKILTLLLLTAASAGPAHAQTRPFRMGFTPWPYEATAEAVDWVYDAVNADGDIISHHMDEGVPWPEAYADTAFPAGYMNEITGRTTRYRPGKKVLLSITPLNGSRSGMANYRGSTGQQPLPAPWDGYALDSPEVKTAFVNYARRMVAYFQPDYLCFGIEVNLLLSENKTLWPAYVSLHRHIYTELKNSHPDLPLTVSLVSPAFFPEWSPEHNLADQLSGLADIEDYVDFISFSVHPFMSALLCDSFPDNYFPRLFANTSKPVAITESSYPAQAWNLGDITFNGSPQKQDDFATLMLEACADADAEFVVWFTIRDYDTLWANTLGADQLSLIWRDTGLFDEAGTPRAALTTWQGWYARTYADPNGAVAYTGAIQPAAGNDAGLLFDLYGHRMHHSASGISIQCGPDGIMKKILRLGY